MMKIRSKEVVMMYVAMSMMFMYSNVRDLLQVRFDSESARFLAVQEEASNRAPVRVTTATTTTTKNKPKYYYDEPEQMDPNTFQGVHARAFQPWTNEVRCFPKDETKREKERGMLFLKTLKTGSTTAMGV